MNKYGVTKGSGFDMTVLRSRRLKGDMIEVSKMIHDITKINVGKLCPKMRSKE